MLHFFNEQDAMIRAGKRETWKWEPHEIFELRRRLQQQLADASNTKVILWAFDDSCLAHTKRRVISISDVPEGTPETDAIVRSIADDAEELLAGLKRILRQILQALTFFLAGFVHVVVKISNFALDSMDEMPYVSLLGLHLYSIYVNVHDRVPNYVFDPA
jgi:hypothetical protein